MLPGARGCRKQSQVRLGNAADPTTRNAMLSTGARTAFEYHTLPKLPLPSTIRKLKSDSFIRSLLPLLSNLEMAFCVFSSAAFDPGPILALCKREGGGGEGGKKS